MCALSACKDFQEYIYYDKGQHYKKSLKIPKGQSEAIVEKNLL
jgi:hypothetical protein